MIDSCHKNEPQNNKQEDSKTHLCVFFKNVIDDLRDK